MEASLATKKKSGPSWVKLSDRKNFRAYLRHPQLQKKIRVFLKRHHLQKIIQDFDEVSQATEKLILRSLSYRDSREKWRKRAWKQERHREQARGKEQEKLIHQNYFVPKSGPVERSYSKICLGTNLRPHAKDYTVALAHTLSFGTGR